MSACAECREAFSGDNGPDMVDVLSHWVKNHWDTPTMRRVLADTSVRTRCEGCGRFMTSPVSVGSTGLYVESYCEACIEDDQLLGFLVSGISAEYVIENEVSSKEDKSGGSP